MTTALDNFTLLVPVRDRQHNLSRVAAHYADLPCRKIVFDSSRQPYPESC